MKELKNGSLSYVTIIVKNLVLPSENTRNEYNEKIESLKKAWALVGRDLKTHGMFLVLSPSPSYQLCKSRSPALGRPLLSPSHH